MGRSTDAFFPFRFDITDVVKPGNNQLLVRVEDSSVNGGPAVRPSGWSWFLPAFRGIQYPVHLEITGNITIDDTFIISKLRPRSSLEAKVTLTNRGRQSEKITLTGVVGKEFSFTPATVTLAPGTSREIVMRGNWAKPHIWWPHDPYLYYLDLKVVGNGKLIDTFRQRFGFRELSVAGPDILLNGVRFLHRRHSVTSHRKYSFAETIKEYIALLRSRGFNGLRLHGGPSLRIIRAADETGFLISPESAINEPRGNRVKSEYWKYAEQHIHNMVKTFRNHPSVIYWCLSNEFGSYYIKGAKPEVVARVDAELVKFGKLTERLDPTRTWTCSGDGSLGGIKGKEGPAPTLSFHYPSQPFYNRNTIPCSIYWLSSPVASWHEIKWKFDKPLMFSEDLYMPYGISPPIGMARWAGDAAYDVRKGYYQGWFDMIRMYAEGYYHDKLSVWNIWDTYPEESENPLYKLGQPIPDYLVCTREWNTSFWSGEQVKRRLFAYNSMFVNQSCVLNAKLRVNDKIVHEFTREFQLKAGGRATFDLTLPMPQVSGRTPAQWQLNLSANAKPLTARTYDYTIYPRKHTPLVPSGCALLTDDHALFKNVNFDRGRHVQLTSAFASNATHLVIANWKPRNNEDIKRLNQAVRDGMKVLWLEPSAGQLPFQLLRGLKETYSFVQAPLDPVMAKITNRDLKLWRKDEVVVTSAPAKPTSGTFDILADAGRSQQYAVIVRLYDGKGYYLICSLPVITRFNQEPAAAYLAEQLMQLFAYAPHSRADTLGVSDIGNTATATELEKLGIPIATTHGTKVLWITADSLGDAAIKRQINDCCIRGGQVVIDGVTPGTVAQLTKLTGITLRLQKHSATEMVKTLTEPLFAGVANDDMFWRQSGDFYRYASCLCTGRKYQTKDQMMMDYAVASGPHLTLPVQPAGIALLPYRNGRLILMTIKWRDFLKIRPRRTARLIVTLLHNLGVRSSTTAEALKEYRFVDMHQVMNRELWQQDDHLLAWFNLNNDDMRYFPVNRPGIDPINNLPQPAEVFPTEPVTLGKIDFKLTNPDTNQGKGCLVLARKDTVAIPVNVKFSKIWMLGAMDGHDRIGTMETMVTFKYTDGSSAIVPIVAGIHVNGFQSLKEAATMGIVAWTGYNPQRSNNVLWAWPLSNPHPQRPVAELVLRHTGKKDLAIIAMSLEP